MKHLIFSKRSLDTFEVAVLIKESYFKRDELVKYYIKPLVDKGYDPAQIIAYDLPYPTKNLKVKEAKKYVTMLLGSLVKQGVTSIFVADAAYFKVLTNHKKPDSALGYAIPCSIKGYGHINVFFGINYGMFIHNPIAINRLDLALDTLHNHLTGTLQPLGDDVIDNATYYTLGNLEAVQRSLDRLLLCDVLTCDVEGYGLRLDSGGIKTIAFAWSKSEGVCIQINNVPNETTEVHRLLKQFFESYKGKLIFHRATFDVKHIIYNCFMRHPLDYHYMLHGLNVMCRDVDDTQIISFLATNTTAENPLNLKFLSHDYLGNYGVDVTDITKIPLDELMEYNLKDVLGTFYVYEKNLPIMLRDLQDNVYNTIMQPSIKLVTQIELCGMPIDLDEVQNAKEYLTNIVDTMLDNMLNNDLVMQALSIIQRNELDNINSKLKSKVHGLDKVADISFNPGSPNQMVILLHEVLTLPVLDKTPTGNPATGADTIEKLINHTNKPEVKQLLSYVIDYNKAKKILSTFIPAFEAAQVKANGAYLHGSFNITGTISGRLSSSDPNLQNLPSNSKYAKPVKQCFRSPKGWLFCGADFDSLEDKVNTLLTRDPNKVAIYVDGYDGHSFRTYYYWPNKFKDLPHAEDTEAVYELNGFVFKGTDEVIYEGKVITINQLFNVTKDI